MVYLTIKFKYFFLKNILESMEVTVRKRKYSYWPFQKHLPDAQFYSILVGAELRHDHSPEDFSPLSMGRIPDEHLGCCRPSPFSLLDYQLNCGQVSALLPNTYYGCNHLGVNPFVDLGLSVFENPTHMGHP